MDAKSAGNDARGADGPRYQPLVLVALAVCAGIVADRRLGWAVPLWWTLSSSAWLAWWVLWRRRWDRAAGLAILVAAAACGGAWHHCRWNLFSARDLGFYARASEQPLCVEALVLTGPRTPAAPAANPQRPHWITPPCHLEIEVLALRNGAKWEPAAGRARLSIHGGKPTIRAGDRIRVFAHFARLMPAPNPGEFDFAAHHRADRVLVVLRAKSPACVSLVKPGAWWHGRRWIDAVRSAGDSVLWKWLDPRRAGIASAVLLGCREEVTAEQTEAFVETGTIHVLSISGMHVGILAASVFWVMQAVMAPRGAVVLVTAAVVAGYTLLADAQPPAVRAMVLVLIVCGAYGLRRRPLGMNSLGAAALIVLVLNPADLFRVGVQLSFLCVMVLVWLSSRPAARDATEAALERLVRQSLPWPRRLLGDLGSWTWELVRVSAVVWLVTAPLVAARFHVITPIALILSPVTWLPTVAALWSGFATLLAGVICPWAVPALSFCCDLAIGLLQWMVETARRVPGSCWWVPGPADWWLLGLYGGLGVLLAWPRVRPPRRWLAAILALWTSVGIGSSLLPDERPQLVCTFASVGHGCGVIIHAPSGATLLYDAGSLMSPERAARGISACLWSQGLTRIDALVLSHPDADHFNAVPTLLERFSIKAVYVPRNMWDREKPSLVALREAIEQAGVPIREIAANDRLWLGPRRPAAAKHGQSPPQVDPELCRVEVLHPPRGEMIGSDNAQSIVLAIEGLGQRILLTGDLDGPGLEDLLKEEPWPCDVLMAPHHGTQASNSPELARWSRPRLVVISGSARTNADDATATYRTTGAEVLHTAEHGAITLRLTENDFVVHTQLGPGRRSGDQASSARQ